MTTRVDYLGPTRVNVSDYSEVMMGTTFLEWIVDHPYSEWAACLLNRQEAAKDGYEFFA